MKAGVAVIVFGLVCCVTSQVDRSGGVGDTPCTKCLTSFGKFLNQDNQVVWKTRLSFEQCLNTLSCVCDNCTCDASRQWAYQKLGDMQCGADTAKTGLMLVVIMSLLRLCLDWCTFVSRRLTCVFYIVGISSYKNNFWKCTICIASAAKYFGHTVDAC